MIKLVEYIAEKLTSTRIFEMAFQRRVYMKTLFDLRLQLVENWALIRYCTLQKSNEEYHNLIDVSQTRNHWEKELRAHISNLYNMKLDVDKTRATEQELIEYSEFKNIDNIKEIIEFKFDVEGILNDDAKDIIDEIAKDFVEYGLDELIEIICKKKLSVNEIKEYLSDI